MHSVLEFLLHHGYAVLLIWVFAEQLGLPVPSLPILLAAGALAGSGKFNFAGSIFLSVLAALVADSI
jgi:membrane protein DedA with SNARE-associated domain